MSANQGVLSIVQPKQDKRAMMAEWARAFDPWWRDCWKKVSKEQARRTWAKIGTRYLGPGRLKPDELLMNVRAMQAHFEQNIWPAQQSRPYPSTWLNDQAFDDESVAEVVDG